MNKTACLLILTVLCAVWPAHAIQGKVLHVDPGWGDVPQGIYIIDAETFGWDTLTFGNWGAPAGMMGGFSPDGRKIYTFVRDRGIREINNDGTGFGWLIKFPISSDRTDAFAVNAAGIFWMKDKLIHRLNVNTLVIDTVADVSGYGDGSQWYATSTDGLKAYAWMHSTTVKLVYEPDFSDYTLTDMGIWGHGTVITHTGSHIVYDAWSEGYGALPGLGHHTWVVYDFDTGTEVKKFASGTEAQVGTWGVRPCRNNDDYLIFSSDSTFVLNWVTEEKWHIRGCPGHDEFWLGDLPTLYTTPAVRLEPGTVSFTSTGTVPAPQSVTVGNSGVGTLDDITITVSAASSWLSATAQGTGNSQILEVTVDPAGLSEQTHSGSVIVSAPNSANADTLLVQFTVGTALAAPTNLSATLGYDGTTVSLRWTDNADNEDGYVVERDAGAGFAEVARVGADMHGYEDTSLALDDYTYRVRAYDVAGTSAPSNEVPVTVDGIVTFAVTAPAPGDTFTTGETITIAWSATVTNNVEIKVSNNGGEDYTTITEHGGITQEMPEWGNYQWTIPDSMAGTDVIVMVNAYQEVTPSIQVSGIVIEPSAATRPGLVSMNPTESGLTVRHRHGATTVLLTHPSQHPVVFDILALNGTRVMRVEALTNEPLSIPAETILPGSYVVVAKVGEDVVCREQMMVGGRR